MPFLPVVGCVDGTGAKENDGFVADSVGACDLISDPKAKDDPIEAIGVFVTGTTDTGPVSPKENVAGGFVILAAIMFEVETGGSTVDLLITFVTELLVVLCALKEKPPCKDGPLKLKPAEVGIVDTLCEVCAGSAVVCEGEREAVYGGGKELVLA